MGSGAYAGMGIPYMFLIPLAAYAGTLQTTQTASPSWLSGLFSSDFSGAGLIVVFGVLFLLALAASTAATPGMGRLLLVAGGGVVMWMLMSAFALPYLLTWTTYGALAYAACTLVELISITFACGGGGI